MEAVKSFASLLNNTTPVKLVANTTIKGNPLVTPLLNQDESPKTDINGNPLGSIRLEQKTKSLANGSFLNVRNRVAFISGTMEQLQAILNENKLVDGSELPGKIVVTESLEPFWKGQTSKINPQTNETIGVTVADKMHPVYLRMLYTEDMAMPDKFIRTAEDVIEWLNVHKVMPAAMAATVSATAPETAGMPTAAGATN